MFPSSFVSVLLWRGNFRFPGGLRHGGFGKTAVYCDPPVSEHGLGVGTVGIKMTGNVNFHP